MELSSKSFEFSHEILNNFYLWPDFLPTFVADSYLFLIRKRGYGQLLAYSSMIYTKTKIYQLYFSKPQY